MSSMVTFGRPDTIPASERRLLLLFDGGNAPGYSSVAVALTEEGERRGYEVWAATQGFRSLTRDATSHPPFQRLIVRRPERALRRDATAPPPSERLMVSRKERDALLAQGIPARSMGRRVLDAGSDFRSER